MRLLAREASTHHLEYALVPRTTLTLDPDVAAELERRRRERGTTLKGEVNELLRAGLSQAGGPTRQARPFETQPLPIGRPLVESFDDIGEVLAFSEGEEHR
jgi:hypothetical protein